MRPEVKLITPAHVAAQQAIFDGEAERFGQLYARGQNQFRGERTPISAVITSLTEARLNLTETRARQTAQAVLDDLLYRQTLAASFAHEYMATGDTILAATQRENSDLGFVDGAYRANMTFDGASLRALGGIGLISAAVYGWIMDPNAMIAAEAGIFIGTTGILDATRHLLLRSFLRNGRNTNGASTANLIQRQASFREGLTTGDEIDGPQPINQALEQRLAGEVLSQLELDGIRRPDMLNPTDYSDILCQRVSLRSRLPRYEDLPELVQSRNIAKGSRLTRTLLCSALAAGLLFVHFSRPEDCGTSAFSAPDPFMQEVTGASKVSSVRGMAEAQWFRRVFRKPFNLEDPKDREAFDRAYESDRETNEQVINEIYRLIRAANPDMVTGGLISHDGLVNNLCQGAIGRATNH